MDTQVSQLQTGGTLGLERTGLPAQTATWREGPSASTWDLPHNRVPGSSPSPQPGRNNCEGGGGGTCWLPSLYPRGLARGSQVRDLCPKVGGPVVTVLEVPTGPGTAGSGRPRPPSALVLAGADAGGGGWGGGGVGALAPRQSSSSLA